MRLRRNVFLYFRFFKQQLKAIIEYETDFLITLVVAVLAQALGFIFLYVVYQRIPEINGWHFWEVTVMYAMVYLSEGFVSFFFNGVWGIGGFINQGSMDRMLLRPVSPIVQVLGSEVGMNGLGNIIFGIVLIIQGLRHLDVDWSAIRISGAVLMLLCAVMIRTAINLASNTAAFWMQSNRNAFPYLVHSLSDFARFPISIYSITMQLVVSVGIPYAFISFFPAAYVFEKTPWGVYGWLAPVIALYSMFIAYRLFQSGIKRYESTGN